MDTICITFVQLECLNNCKTFFLAMVLESIQLYCQEFITSISLYLNEGNANSSRY